MNILKFLIIFLVSFQIVNFQAEAANPGVGQLREIKKAYQGGNLEMAALRAYNLSRTPITSKVKTALEYFQAKIYFDLEMYQMAYFYAGQIVRKGARHPRFKEAINMLVNLNDRFADPVIIPETLNRYYSGAFVELKPDILGDIHYMIGKRYYERRKYQRAREFLNAIPKGHARFPHSLYLLGVIEFKEGNDASAKKYFDSILTLKNLIKDNSKGARVKDLTNLALARMAYEAGQFKKSVEFYQAVTKFSGDWFDSLFERSWAHFVLEEYGKALGDVHSVTSPYFAAYFIPEALVLKATVYIENCLYNETNAAIAEYRSIYDPVEDALNTFNSKKYKPREVFEKVVSEKSDEVPLKVKTYLLNVGQFKRYNDLVQQASKEVEKAKTAKYWSAAMKQEVMRQVEQTKNAYMKLAGRFAKFKMKDLSIQLKNFKTQIQTLEVQMKLSEKDLLTSNVDIASLIREDKAKAIPETDRYVYWSFDEEYWIDELGYYEFTIKGACK